jgi:hypothetical protein
LDLLGQFGAEVEAAAPDEGEKQEVSDFDFHVVCVVAGADMGGIGGHVNRNRGFFSGTVLVTALALME